MAARYEALVGVSEALGACHDRDVLFRSLARELRCVVNFSFLGLALYDERIHTMEPCVLKRQDPVPPPQIPTEESLAYWVLQHQEPVLIRRREGDLFSEAIAYMRQQGMCRSVRCHDYAAASTGNAVAGNERHAYG
jgi:hypothetical protein